MMLRKLLPAAGLALVLAAPSYAAEPQKFGDEAKATAFCKAGNVVWFDPESKSYYRPGGRSYGKTKVGGYTCEAFADKEGYGEGYSPPLRGTPSRIFGGPNR